MKVLITGGHFSPARAVIHAFSKDVQIVYVGRKHGLESDSALSLEYTLMHQDGIPFREIQPGRLHRVVTRYTPSSVFKLFKGVYHAWHIVSEEKPDVILSFGGYVAASLCFAGFLQHIPVVLHEQTFEAGLANKVIAFFAKKVCLSWPSSQQYFPKGKTVVTGNPTLAEMFTYHSKQKRNHPFTILVTGGNSGAHMINLFIERNLEKILEEAVLIHQTGDAQQFQDFPRLTALRETLPKKLQERYTIQKFFTPEVLHQHEADADLIITRAGANTIGELLILNKPSLVFPIPYTQRDEQKKNAAFLVNTGLAVSLDQETTTDEQFLATLHDMIKQITTYARKPALEPIISSHLHAAQTVAEITQEVARGA